MFNSNLRFPFPSFFFLSLSFFLGRNGVFFLSYFLVFFYKFPPQFLFWHIFINLRISFCPDFTLHAKRLVYMLEHDPPLVNLRKVEWLIIDEADKLFEVGIFFGSVAALWWSLLSVCCSLVGGPLVCQNILKGCCISMLLMENLFLFEP